MTYGWALLVVLIVIAALAFFGLLNPNRFLPEKCELAPGITCLDYSATTDDDVSDGDATDTDDTITILLNNGIGQTMESVALNITECRASNNSQNAVIAASIGPGTTHKFQDTHCGGMTANAKFKTDMTLSYNTITEGNTLSHNKQGYLVVSVEKS